MVSLSSSLRRSLRVGFLAVLVAFAPGVTLADPPAAAELEAGRPVDLELGGEALLFHLAVGEGDYIAGTLAGLDHPVSADLLLEDGSHFRQLADETAGAVRFQAVAPAQGMWLRLTGTGRATVQLDTLLAAADQLPVPDGYLSPKIAALAEQLAKGGTPPAFWQEVAAGGTPLVESVEGQIVMTFLWRGASRNVRLFGGPSNNHEWLDRLGESDVWFKSFVVPDGTRLSYQLAPDVPDIGGDARARRGALLATAQVDPLNLNPVPADAPDRFNQDATITLPGAPAQPGTPPADDADPLIQSFVFDSPRLGNSRRITISHPRDLDPADPEAVLLFLFDGEKALTEMRAPQMLETLTRSGLLPPVVTVLIPSIDTATRSRELPGNDLFADVLAQDLLPLVLSRTGLKASAGRTVLAGASYGGLAAATVAIRHPQVFGNALSMSGSFWWAPPGETAEGLPYVAALIARNRDLPLRFFLSAGRFETGREGTAGILETSAILRDVLRINGNDVYWREYAGGHDYVIWRGALADGMIDLFGK